jgi:hypothetical protein
VEGKEMSKKDYVKFADVFKHALETAEDRSGTETGEILDTLIFECTKVFHYDNAAFRPYQFLEACGYSKVQAGQMAARI